MLLGSLDLLISLSLGRETSYTYVPSPVLARTLRRRHSHGPIKTDSILIVLWWAMRMHKQDKKAPTTKWCSVTGRGRKKGSPSRAFDPWRSRREGERR